MKKDSENKTGGFSHNVIGNNFSHNTIIIEDKNKAQSSSQNSTTQTAPAQTATIKKILIGVLVAVIGGLIVWYLTH